jgi:N6-L-threonylcarbamoyladenine synthase
MSLLAFETSCDETAAAVVTRSLSLQSSVVGSQAAIHALYGGVVPEIAGREHVASLIPVYQEALKAAGIEERELEALAVTIGPGLVGSLLVGLSFAQGVAYRLGIPLIGVHHIEGHLLAVLLEREVTFPFLGLVVSGGHTHLYAIQRPGHYEQLGRTLDDAAGEAFDKSAALLKLPYPGGVSIDKIAPLGDRERYAFPRGLQRDPGHNFSFSGLKTSIRTQVEKLGNLTENQVADLAASLQEAIVDSLVTKTLRAAQERGFSRIVVAGGVAANRRLRQVFAERAAASGTCEVIFPSFSLCTDNAAMIGCVGALRLNAGAVDPLDISVRTHWPLDQVAWASR